ncbi:DUF167 domain-containing protein [Parachlamydia sp. AcF125]|uniref:DUF167 domain-containing protein n=1 Tax=Parachlamydia sp. AcF125 TaxID=2795736 RepID=UPI001BCA2F48|nr:DUF167 domain-containing protein [Parachlamydia sp. AcF125]MBS4168639.1 hypothetical protein [Parachlamydia sp. AcF125]
MLKTTLSIKVIPNSSKKGIAGWENHKLKLHISAAPEKGKANEAVIKFLSKFLGIRQQHIQIIQGETSRHKLIQIEGMDYEALIEKINEWMN